MRGPAWIFCPVAPEFLVTPLLVTPPSPSPHPAPPLKTSNLGEFQDPPLWLSDFVTDTEYRVSKDKIQLVFRMEPIKQEINTRIMYGQTDTQLWSEPVMQCVHSYNFKVHVYDSLPSITNLQHTLRVSKTSQQFNVVFSTSRDNLLGTCNVM